MPRTQTMGRNANGVGSIRKITTTRNGKQYTYWQARYTAGYDLGTGKQIQRSITGKTQKEVAQKLKQATYELDQGTYTGPCRLTVKEWLDVWKAEYTGDVKASTAYIYQKNLDMYVVPYIGSVKLQALTAPMVQSLYNRLMKPEKRALRLYLPNPCAMSTAYCIRLCSRRSLSVISAAILRMPASRPGWKKRKFPPWMKTRWRTS